MNLNFTNGTTRQQSQWRQALHRLINLPFDKIPVSVEVTFVDPAELIGKGHTDLAQTEWTYDSAHSSTRVRSDAPGFGTADASLLALAASMGLSYNADTHYNETAAHEAGHAIFAALPQEVRIAIAELFGALSDGMAELFPDGVSWQDRIGEGIADTFKEAFLPRHARVFPNRTNRKIPYSEFPEFRRLFREGIEQIPTGEGFNHDVLELDEKNMRVAWPLSATFRHEGGNSYYTVYEAGYDLFSREITAAHTFAFLFEPAALPVRSPIYPILFGWRYVIKVNGIVRDRFRGVWGYGRPQSGQEVEFWGGFWLPASQEHDDLGDQVPGLFSDWMENSQSFFVPNEFEHEGEGFTDNYRTWEDARSRGAIPTDLSSGVSVEAGDNVSIHARAVGLEWAIPGGPSFEEEARERMGRLEPPWSDSLPLMLYAEPGTEGGEPIDVPKPSLEPTGFTHGRRPTGRPTHGSTQ
jgi:hypothetical protein